VDASAGRGFTLLEVLVALTVLALALLAGSQAGDALVRLSERESTQWLAQLCAENALVAARLDPVFPAPGTRQQDCTQGGHSFTLEIDVGTTPNPSFRRLEVRVAEVQSPQAPLLRLTTVIGRH
jgi:general secretion pathway protein I